jgi:hypothetical protein
MRYGKSPYYCNAREAQIDAGNIADAKRAARKLASFARAEAIHMLRSVGCFEAEIAAVLA